MFWRQGEIVDENGNKNKERRIWDSKSHVIHSAPATCKRLLKEEQSTCGETESFFRLSTGIEGENYLTFDLKQALSEV